mmetsp:Transcript_3182/g.4843  ORF Transcript_3182/g.4843 Transcript_3182/m.4843 type:complete len:407 (-) Transcript_3182:395-1615(-)
MAFLSRIIPVFFSMTLFLPWMQILSHGFLIADMQHCVTQFTGIRQNSNSKHHNSTHIQCKKKGSDSGQSKISSPFLAGLGLCISCFSSGAALQAKFDFMPNPISSASSISLQSPTTELSCVPEAIKKVEQSVVRINTLKPTLIDNRRESPMEQFEESQGSGVLFDSEGLILTNAHVVERMKNIVITLADGRQYSAEIKGSDEQIDIAVLKINPEEGERFAQAEFGNSDKIEVGQVVVALGSPCSLDQTATMGIVSGIGRSPADVGIFDDKDLNVDYIQTDASMNLGSSGGPLVDVESGCVIGINTRIRVHMEGTGFAIPINKVKEILPDLSIRSYIGAFIDNVKPQENWFINRAIVSKVYRDLPAAVGGLMKNDIILKIGGEEIKSNEDVCRCVDRAAIETKVKLI